ncbi:MAG: tyrosine-type recombinase/integrase, partial [Deltaproteobacteria bacterium]|nr:tyrosine-type recombinase/integrase [Deltaproteobacteria bacterium]
TDKNLNSIWRAACEAAKVKQIKLYNAVRHSLGCQLLDEGVEMDIVRQQLGHTRPEMTMRYAKRSQAKLTKMLEKRRAMVVDVASRLQVTN